MNPSSTFALPSLTPPRETRWLGPLLMALVAHGLLVVALTWGVQWQRNAPTAVSAELWSRLPQSAATRDVNEGPRTGPQPPEEAPPTPPDPPAPQPDPAAAAQAREVEAARQAAQAAAAQAQAQADIALQAQKKKEEERQQQALQQAAKAKKEAQEREAAQAKAEQAKQEKLAQQREAERQAKAAREKADRVAKEKAEQAQRAEQAKAAREQKLRAEQLARDRAENIRRIQGMAGATGAPGSAGTAAQSSGPSAGYAGRIVAAVRPNIVFTDNPSDNPTAEVEVRTLPDGTVASRRIVQSSGLPSWDDAVLKALDRTKRLPPDRDGRVPSTLVITFRVKE